MYLQGFFVQLIDTCFNDHSCDIEEGWILFIEPFQWTLGQEFTFVAIWGLLLLIIWLRTQSVQMVGIVGIVLNTMLISFHEPARQVGWVLLGLSIGFVLYQLLTNRLKHGSST